MEFLSTEGKNHILQPIGYNIIRKRIKPGKMLRSAVEQFAIQEIAHNFKSDVLYIPKPITLESNYAYTMEHVYGGIKVPPSEYYKCIPLYLELCRFKYYMLENNFVPRDFTLIAHPSQRVILVDMSKFGIVQDHHVRFPKDSQLYTLLDAEKQYGLLFSCMICIENDAIALSLIDEGETENVGLTSQDLDLTGV